MEGFLHVDARGTTSELYIEALADPGIKHKTFFAVTLCCPNQLLEVKNWPLYKPDLNFRLSRYSYNVFRATVSFKTFI